MTSSRKLVANRANAARSTGPRSPEGKARSSRNAKRHGLSTPAEADPAWQERIAVIASALAGEGAPPALHHHARNVATAQAEVERVRVLRSRLLLQLPSAQAALAAVGDAGPAVTPELDAGRALAQRLVDSAEHADPGVVGERHACRQLKAAESYERAVNKLVSGAFRSRRKKEASARATLAALLAHVAALDRYERRALSRRATATRHFDDARVSAVR